MIELISGSKVGVHLFIDHGNFYTKTTTPIPVSSTLFSDGSREGARGARASFYFQTKLRPEKFFQRPPPPPPPLSQGLYDRCPPARPYLKFWIRHCYYSHVTFTQRPLLDHMPIQNLTGIKTFLFMEINRIMTERKKLVQLRSQLPLIEADQALVMLFMV